MKFYGASNNTSAYSIVTNNIGGFTMIGTSGLSLDGEITLRSRIFVVNTDLNGDQLWGDTININTNATVPQQGVGIISRADNSGFFCIANYDLDPAFDPEQGEFNTISKVALFSVSEEGVLDQSFGVNYYGDDNEILIAQNVIKAANDGLWVIGDRYVTDGTGELLSDIFVLYFDANGGLIRKRIYGKTNLNDYGASLVESGGYTYLCSTTENGVSGENKKTLIRIAKLSSDGDPIWEYDNYGVDNDPSANFESAGISSYNDKFVISGTRVKNQIPTSILLTVDDQGQSDNGIIDLSINSTVLGHIVNFNNEIYVCGKRTGVDNNDFAFVTKCYPNGFAIWDKNFGAVGNNIATSQCLNSEGDVFVSGAIQFDNLLMAMLLKLNEQGSL